MKSIRAKITVVTISAVVLTMIIAMLFGVVAIRNIGMNSSEQMLHLLCEAGQKSIDAYLKSLKLDVDTISAYIESDLTGLEDDELQEHIDRVSEFSENVISKTSGIVTYYYRIDPSVSSNVKGFWFVNLDGKGFKEHEVTDITEYDTGDTSKLVWFTVPKATEKPVWLAPYITDNLDTRVISYNVPVYFNGKFVGVIGVEMEYKFMAELVDNITLYENGYAFINDQQGKLIYHPRMDVLTMDDPPATPEGISSNGEVSHYTYNGTEKIAVGLPLINGVLINVSVPLKEVNESWQTWIKTIAIVFCLLIAVFIAFFMRFTGRITKPLKDLTKIAEQIDKGNYDDRLEYKGNDEIGVLANTFNRVSKHLKKHITDLNDLAYADALTSLHNKGAFDKYIDKIQTRLDQYGGGLRFAVCIFDCNRLKMINDSNGHEKGDAYLKGTAAIICEVFDHSPVFRIGGDEFAAVLTDCDYENREDLLKRFDELCSRMCNQNAEDWKKIDVARGMAVYDPESDHSVDDVVRRADKNMYEHKWESKKTRSE